MATGRYVPPERRSAEVVLQRVSRWSFLAAVVLLVWLIVPIARCAKARYGAIQLGDATDDEAGEVDRDRVRASKGFFLSTIDAVEACQRQTPLLGQRGRSSAFVLAGATSLVSWALGRMLLQHRRARMP